MKKYFVLFLLVGCAQLFSHVSLADEEDAQCLACHGSKDLAVTFADGETLSLYVNQSAMTKSVHTDILHCSSCHDISLDKHPSGSFEFQSRKKFQLSMYEICKTCHFSNYTKLLESVHYDLLMKGNDKAPVCTDCHGYHNVERTGDKKQNISQSCAKCHQKIYNEYTLSVHGRALIDENNMDVPVCTDCHKAHNIEDPRLSAFQVNTPEMCGNCHSNEKLMKKYGISTDVLKSYLNDFHGVSLKMYQKTGSDQVFKPMAMCTDCHGVHNITKTNAPNANNLKENLLARCQKCHANASANFPDTWLSHYEPTLKNAPLVYLVKISYKFIIPFIIIGLLLHVLLHIWRIVVNR